VRIVQTCLVISTLAAPALAAAEQLDVKTGQWQMTASVHMDGPIIPPEALAHLPPDARARIEGALQSAQQPHTNRSCMTEDKLQHGFDLDQSTHGHCHQQLLNLSSHAMEVRGVCEAPDGASTMHATITAVDRETIQGVIDVNRDAARGPTHITVSLAGKWLGPDCHGKESGD
jgi:hypothetical protein